MTSQTIDVEAAKTEIGRSVDDQRSALIDLSHRIHAHPELGYEETKASGWLADYLEEQGFSVERGICGLPTAFRASYGTGEPVLAFMAEYDALPEVGHGCGHNIIGTAAVGAAVASKVIADQEAATIQLLGCPAEELLGGKIPMVENGVFDDVDAALQIHCVPKEENWVGFRGTAVLPVDVEYIGNQTHAAVSPWDGASALQALINAFNNINALRLHLRDMARVAGIITDGGTAANVIPGRAAGKFMLRSHDEKYLDEMKEKVTACLEAAAASTGTTLSCKWGRRCHALSSSGALLEAWTGNMEAMGQRVAPINTNSGSTDVGNVSVTVPTIHPFLSIADGDAPFHSSEMRDAACSEKGDRAVVLGAKMLAMTGVDLAADPEILDRAWEELQSTRKNLGLAGGARRKRRPPA